MQVVLSGFSVILFCFVQAKTLCRYAFYVFPGSTRAYVCRCVGDVIRVVYNLNRCSR